MITHKTKSNASQQHIKAEQQQRNEPDPLTAMEYNRKLIEVKIWTSRLPRVSAEQIIT